ncbi:MAG: GNAT family protein [Burkholderiaceae bacterium]|nr:GNAT family protein [Burkholderiaceae bacterium]
MVAETGCAPVVRLQPLRLPDQAAALVAFLTGEDWPFHYDLRPAAAQVQASIDAGRFASLDAQTFWVMVDDARAGLIRLYDLQDVDDGEPQFDLRVTAASRGCGVARAALHALCDHAFGSWPQLARISAETRADNLAMRRVLAACGFVLEGQLRCAWQSANGARHDALWFGLLRSDWSSGEITPVQWVDDVRGA